jgi:hypothetical protein
MPTVLFIHGINVRGPELDRTLACIEPRLRDAIPEAVLASCKWGDDLGARLNANGNSVPDYDTARAVADLPELSDTALWQILYADPLFELRVLGSTRGNKDPGLSPGELGLGEDLQERLEDLKSAPACTSLFAFGSMQGAMNRIIDAHCASHEVMRSLDSAARNPELIRGALARSLVARMIQVSEDAGVPCMTGVIRDQFVKTIEEQLGGEARGVVSWLSDLSVGFAKNLGTRYARRKRGALSDLTCPVIGDVLRYQGRGDAIRERIATSIQAQPEGVVVLAHSLGGVALVDTLLLQPHLRARISQLVTVGSQAGFFYENDALVGLAFGELMPSDFPRWMNVYDRADMLSFLTVPLLGVHADDQVLNNGQPFPQSHSAYWSNPALYDLIAARMGR